jgi:hypothetical protein
MKFKENWKIQNPTTEVKKILWMDITITNKSCIRWTIEEFLKCLGQFHSKISLQEWLLNFLFFFAGSTILQYDMKDRIFVNTILLNETNKKVTSRIFEIKCF